MPSEHAVLSCSASHRWLECTPSARLEQEFEDQTSDAAKEGTAAHALAEYKIKQKLGMPCEKPVSEYEDADMRKYTDDYADYVWEMYMAAKQLDENAQIFIEQRVDLGCYVPESFGTCDCCIVYLGNLIIIDFKYGKGVFVDATDNSQMKLYALGALRIFQKKFKVKNVSTRIYQPRKANLSIWDITVAKLKAWARKTVKVKAELAFAGEGELNPGEWCQFCKAACKCRARATENLKLLERGKKAPSLLTDAEIGEILLKIPAAKEWIEAIWDYAESEAVKGEKSWAGFKVVEKETKKRYSDEKAIAQVLKDAGYTDIYQEIKLKNQTDLKKLMGEAVFNGTVGPYLLKPKGDPIMVEESDNRPAINAITEAFKKKIKS